MSRGPRPGSTGSWWRDALAAVFVAVLMVVDALRSRGAAKGASPHGDGVAAPGRDRRAAGPPAAGQNAGPAAHGEPPPPAGVHLPKPSVWPAVLAAGVALLLFGVVTSLSFSAVGVVLVARALVGWLGELLHA